MGELCERRMGKHPQATELYRKAIGEDSAYRPALRALAQLLREHNEWAALIKVLRQEIAITLEPEIKALNWFRIGQVNEHRLDDLDAAVMAYERALEAMPRYRPALFALARLRTEQRDWGRFFVS